MAPVTGFCDKLIRLVAWARLGGLDPELKLRAAAQRLADRVREWKQAQQN
jgi:hypothetical protein